MKTKGGCATVPLRIGQYEYKSDMLALPLGGYDVVLGVQWLRTLGDQFCGTLRNLQWNFGTKGLKFVCPVLNLNLLSPFLFSKWKSYYILIIAMG